MLGRVLFLVVLVLAFAFVNLFPVLQPAARTWPSMLATAAADLAFLVFIVRLLRRRPPAP